MRALNAFLPQSYEEHEVAMTTEKSRQCATYEYRDEYRSGLSEPLKTLKSQRNCAEIGRLLLLLTVLSLALWLGLLTSWWGLA